MGIKFGGAHAPSAPVLPPPLLSVANSPPQALHETHSFIYKLITQSYSPETLYALDNFEVSTQYEYS